MRIEGVNDYSLYQEIEKMIGYCGFITREAHFLKVYKEGEYHTSHSQYASDYFEAIGRGEVKDVPEYLKKSDVRNTDNVFDVLIEMLGYISYSLEGDTSYVVLPSTLKITEEQKNLLKKLNELNHVQVCTNIKETQSVTNRKKC